MFKSRKNSSVIDMTDGPIFPIILKIAIPLMLSGVLQILFNAADMIVVGKFGSDQSLAAVSSTGALSSLIVGLFINFSIGSNVLCARLFGGSHIKRMSDAVHTSIFLSIVIGAFLTVVGFFSAEYLLSLLDTPESILSLASLYLRIYFLGMIPMLVYNFAAAILRAVGDTKRPLFYLVLAGIINVILNLILVMVFKLDVAGVAIATVVSNTISAFCCIRALMKANDATKLYINRLKIDFTSLKEILRIGIPAGIQSALFSIANVFIQASMNSFDNEFLIAGSGASTNIENFAFTALGAIQQAIVSFTGQNYGRRNYKRIVTAVIYGTGFALIFGAVICFTMVHFSGPLLNLYVSNEEAIKFGMTRMATVGTFSFLLSASEVFTGGMRGCGYSVSTMITSLFCICFLRLTWVNTVFRIPEYHTYETLILCYPISFILSFVVQGISLIFVMQKVKKKLTAQL